MREELDILNELSKLKGASVSSFITLAVPATNYHL